MDWVNGFYRLSLARWPGGTYSKTDPWKLALHTTEGSYASAIAAYNGGTGCPHFTVDLDSNVYVQHVPLSRSAYALRNEPGGTETNREGVIQVELVGYAAQTHNWPIEKYMKLAFNVIEPIRRAQPGIALAFPPQGFTGNDGYGTDGRVRMSHAQWDSFSGILGHSHVPENTHWDPGALKSGLLLDLLKGKSSSVKEGEMGYFEKYYDPEAKQEFIVTQKRDNGIVFRRFTKVRGDGKSMAGLKIVLSEFVKKGIVSEVKPL